MKDSSQPPAALAQRFKAWHILAVFAILCLLAPGGHPCPTFHVAEGGWNPGYSLLLRAAFALGFGACTGLSWPAAIARFSPGSRRGVFGVEV